jgi:hypothetical protein
MTMFDDLSNVLCVCISESVYEFIYFYMDLYMFVWMNPVQTCICLCM